MHYNHIKLDMDCIIIHIQKLSENLSNRLLTDLDIRGYGKHLKYFRDVFVRDSLLSKLRIRCCQFG